MRKEQGRSRKQAKAIGGTPGKATPVRVKVKRLERMTDKDVTHTGKKIISYLTLKPSGDEQI